MNQANIPAEGCPVTEAELEAIARYSRRRLTAEEVYTFPLVLCDNDLDRDHECFTDAALEKLGVSPVGEAGEEFNPELHNAVAHVEDESIAENTIVEVFQKGYMLKEKVIRHAMVKVAN